MSRYDEQETRALPHSIDAEQAVLGGLMLDPASLAKISDWLAEDDFYRKDHRVIFRAITELSKVSRPCDAVTLCEWFDLNGLSELVNGSIYILELANSTPSAANIVAYAEIVREKAVLRKLIDAGTTLVSDSFSPNGRASADIVANASHALSGLAATPKGGLMPAKGAFKALVAQQIERYEAGPKLLGLPTPWHELNKITHGLRPGVLYIVGARPSMGKSVFIENLAFFSALRGTNTAIFSAEMTAQEYAARATASHGDIPFAWVEQPSNDKEWPDAEIYWSRNGEIVNRLMKAPVLIDDTPAININQLQARARRAHMQKPLELIVVDHLHDMDHGRRPDGVRHEIGIAVQGLKTLAKEFHCPVVVAAQLNRGVANRTDKRPTLADLREAGEIEQKGDVIMFLHREDYYDQNKEPGCVQLIPAKGRNIKVGETIYLRNSFDRMRLDDGERPHGSSQESARSNKFDAQSDPWAA